MSRSLDGATQLLERSDVCGLTTLPISIFIWGKPSAIAGGARTLISMCENGGGYDDAFKSLIESSGVVSGQSIAGGTYGIANTSATASTGAWQSFLAVYASATSRTIYLDGANAVTDTSNVSPNFAQLNRFVAGALGFGTPTDFFAGLVGGIAVYGAALSGADAADLDAGVPPDSIGGCVAYWPLTSNQSPEPAEVGAYDLTLTGSPTFSTDDPPLLEPAASVIARLVSQMHQHRPHLRM